MKVLLKKRKSVNLSLLTQSCWLMVHYTLACGVYPLKWQVGRLGLVPYVFLCLWLVFPVNRPGFWTSDLGNGGGQISPPLYRMNRSALVFLGPTVLQTCGMVRKWVNEEVVPGQCRVWLMQLQGCLLLRPLICQMGRAVPSSQGCWED